MKHISKAIFLFCAFFSQGWSEAPCHSSLCDSSSEALCDSQCQEEKKQQMIHRAMSARPSTYQDSDVREAPEADEAYSWPGRRDDDFYDEFTR